MPDVGRFSERTLQCVPVSDIVGAVSAGLSSGSSTFEGSVSISCSMLGLLRSTLVHRIAGTQPRQLFNV